MTEKQEKIINQSVKMLTVSEDEAGQRIDNYLLAKLKGVPKSLIYRILRKGEVRVNKGRIKPEYKLQNGDVVRVPPVRVSEKNTAPISKNLNKVASLESHIIFEDDCLLVLNKPSGIAVHGGSGLNFGVIEALRALRPEARFLELVHRLDRDTSGILLVAKKRSALRNLHEQLRVKTVQKDYLALVRGQWQSHVKVVQAPLLKNELASGERIVKVSEQGKPSETRFAIEERYQNATLVKASPVTEGPIRSEFILNMPVTQSRWMINTVIKNSINICKISDSIVCFYMHFLFDLNTLKRAKHYVSTHN